MNRWKMHKLGFVHFWLYDQEEFSLENGHILLRGNNGSGKSVTTQSFIPFILDGNRRPERLDPFGTRDRKMEFYLLGEDGQEEATGYLYLEFKKEALEEYLTIGIGMRAQRGKGIDFWGFCLDDGRRIGPEGVQLCEKVGGQLLPLSRQKLKNLLDNKNNWAESPDVYKQLVNDRVFQFRDIRQYDQLIQLLIKVRTPKLSKDAFRPSALKEILNASLQVLTDEDLSAMVSTMERMDALEDMLRGYQTAIQDARIIRNEYTRYNQYILGSKGRAYLDAHSAVLRLSGQLEGEQARRGDLEARLAQQKERAEQSGNLYQQAKAQRAAMGDDDLSAKRVQLGQARETCALLQNQLEQGEASLRTLIDGISHREVRLRELTRQRDNARDSVRLALRDLDDGNMILDLGEEHEDYIHNSRMEQNAADQKQVCAALRRRRKQIDEVLRYLERTAQAKDAYDAACQALDQGSTEVVKAESALRDAQLQEQDERDRLLEGFARQQAKNVQLCLTEEDALAVRRALVSYRSPADWSPIRNRLDGCVLRRESELSEEKFRALERQNNLKAEQEKCERTLERLKKQPDPTPPRSERIQATRIQLMLRGIPCAAFYETIDFVPDLPQEARDLLEAQLTDAGLLDALVVPPERLDEVRDLLEEYPDRFLLPGPPAEQPLEALIPDGADAFREAAAACLRGISRTDLECQTAVLPDGRFRCGMVRGYSQAEGPAGYIGAAARRANRARQIQELEEQIAERKEQIQSLQRELDRIASCLTALREERTQMPTAEDLDQALEMLVQAHRTLLEAEAEKERRLSEEHKAKHTLSMREQEVRTASAGLPYARTIPAYEEARDAAEEYQALLGTLENHRLQLEYTVRQVQDAEDALDEQRDYADQVKKSNTASREMLEVNRAAAGELQAFLDRPENQARAKRLEELEREIERQNGENRDAEIQCAQLAEQLKASEETIAFKEQSLREAALDEQELENYFSEDLALGFSGLDREQGLEKCAREAAGRMQASDRERTPDQVQEALRNNYQQHNSNILKYRPEIRIIFDAPAKTSMLRQRLCVTLNWKGKELSLYEFIQMLQAEIDMTATLLEDQDRELFENILTETISLRLRRRIEESRRWAQDMTALMSTLDTSMGLTFSLDWKAKKAEGGEELDTAQLVTLLNKDRALLSREDSQRVSSHFRAKVRKARETAYTQGLALNYAELIREVLDYRNWYEFRLFYLRSGEVKKELTDRVFNRFSGGEKAMAMYVPLFASVSAQYEKSEAKATCPQLLALDEAFAGVDEKNIGAMFGLVHRLGFDYIMNSQSLWGCYSCVDDLDIADLHRPANASVVTILRYRWNGQVMEGEA